MGFEESRSCKEMRGCDMPTYTKLKKFLLSPIWVLVNLLQVYFYKLWEDVVITLAEYTFPRIEYVSREALERFATRTRVSASVCGCAVSLEYSVLERLLIPSCARTAPSTVAQSSPT
jgi:hypothetical protein